MKGAADCFPDAEAETDFRLAGAMHFDFIAPLLRQHCANGAGRELRRIAIAAEMPEDDPLQFPGKQLLDHGCRRGVREVAVAGLDALLYRPGPMRIVLEQFLVVVRLDHERMDLPQPFDHHLRRVTQIGDVAERARAGVKNVSHRVDRIMWDGKGLDGDIAHREVRTGAEQPPVPVARQRSATDRFRGERVAINRDMKFPAKHIEAADVIAVFVGEQDPIELVWGDSALGQAQDQLPRA